MRFHIRSQGADGESRLIFFERAPERNTPPNNQQPTSPAETGKDNPYRNRLLHLAIQDAKDVLEGKYAQNPSAETKKKLTLFERLFDEQYKRFQRGEYNAALQEMDKLKEEIWESLTRSPQMRRLKGENRFDDPETQKEIRKIWEDRNFLRNSQETTHVEIMYRLLLAKEAGDETIMSKVNEFLTPRNKEYIAWLRAALGPDEKDELRSVLEWHMQNRPGLDTDKQDSLLYKGKEKLQQLMNAIR